MSNTSSQKSLRSLDWGALTREEFWCRVDDLQVKTLSETDGIFSYLMDAPVEKLREILIQYRYFTVYYIPDLALLVARLPNGPMRSFLADILNDELGVGNSTQAHPRLYDEFLQSIGVDVSRLSLDTTLRTVTSKSISATSTGTFGRSILVATTLRTGSAHEH